MCEGRLLDPSLCLAEYIALRALLWQLSNVETLTVLQLRSALLSTQRKLLSKFVLESVVKIILGWPSSQPLELGQHIGSPQNLCHFLRLSVVRGSEFAETLPQMQAKLRVLSQNFREVEHVLLSECIWHLMGSIQCGAASGICSDAILIESEHPYDNNVDFHRRVHLPGATALKVHFDLLCKTEPNYDWLTFYSDAERHHVLHKFTGRTFNDVTITGAFLLLRMLSQSSSDGCSICI